MTQSSSGVPGSDLPENTGQKQGRRSDGKFAKGSSGNRAGKPKGTRSVATLAAQQLLDGEARSLTRKAIDMALAGDTTALRLCFERLLPPRKDRPVLFDLPPIERAEDAAKALAAITAAVAKGEITPSEARDLTVLVDAFVKALEAGEFERRLAALEAGVQA